MGHDRSKTQAVLDAITAETGLRFNENHDPSNGQFASGSGGGSSSSESPAKGKVPGITTTAWQTVTKMATDVADSMLAKMTGVFHAGAFSKQVAAAIKASDLPVEIKHKLTKPFGEHVTLTKQAFDALWKLPAIKDAYAAGNHAASVGDRERFNENHDPGNGQFAEGAGGTSTKDSGAKDGAKDGGSTAPTKSAAAPSGDTATPDTWVKANPRGNGEIVSIAQGYLQSANLPPLRVLSQQSLDPTEGRSIADSYDAAVDDPSNAETIAAYKAFHSELDAQRAAIEKAGYTFEPWEKSGQPYANSAAMMQDVRDNKHLYYFKSTEGTTPNPLTTLAQNDTFRAVHDFFGHAMGGNQFGPKGETNAFLDHVQMFSPAARKALATETVGQNGWFNFSKANEGKPITERRFADQKAFLLNPKLYQPLIDRAMKRSATMDPNTRADEIDENDYYFACPGHRRDAVRFNENHDPSNGQFASGSGGSGGSGGTATAAKAPDGIAAAATHDPTEFKPTGTPKPMKPPTQGQMAKLSPAAQDATRKLWSGATQAVVSVKTPGNGFSLDPMTMTPAAGHGRYFSSVHGAEHTVPVDKLTERHIMGYRQFYAPMLNSDRSLVLGGWHRPEDGKVYLDVSKSFHDEAEAKAFGVKNKQYSIYDTHTGQVIPLHVRRRARAGDDSGDTAESDVTDDTSSETGGDEDFAPADTDIEANLALDQAKYKAMFGHHGLTQGTGDHLSADDSAAITEAWNAMGVDTGNTTDEAPADAADSGDDAGGDTGDQP